MANHPSRDILGSHGEELRGRRIALGVCGSVACVRSVDLARALMRHGAEVFPVMTPEACRLIHPNLLTWATGHDTVVELTGAIEHVALAGNVEGKADLVLVAPATANTVGKIACGIDDTPVTTVVTTAVGESIPVVVVPAMHEPMYNHPAVKRNLAALEEMGLHIIMPRVEEGKAKIADTPEVLRCVLEILDPGAPPAHGALAGKRILITAGRTVEYIDPVRVITNNSTGKMGMALAEEALLAGAQVTVVYGKGTASPPNGAEVVHVDTADEMSEAVFTILDREPPDICIAAAAVGDWRAKSPAREKISTHDRKTLTLELEPTPKIIDRVKDHVPGVFLVAFRAQHDLSTADLLADAHARLVKARADLIATNDVSIRGAGFESDTNEMYLLGPDGQAEHLPLDTKAHIAAAIIRRIAADLAGS